MHVEPSSVASVELIGPKNPEFECALQVIPEAKVREVLKPALPFSVFVRNNDSRILAFLGIRFDMEEKGRKPFSVVHYADSLRNPEKADLKPGASRFVCAEPLYTDMVLRHSDDIDKRGPMNLENLAAADRVRVSLDCAAFDDGAFEGPDALDAFDRLALETIAEARFLAELLRPGCSLHALLDAALEIPVERTRDRALLARRAVARRVAEGLYLGGIEEALHRARNYKVRITLHRSMR
jgi:hypothetical protein